ncbi:alpha/beta hydrolase [Psychrobacillus sp. NPDC058041]|uniref:alpha/beta hydrolase n=1 Tax=Psychrobacillus sp. NPDC058041 TaxID=3346310 RepID=UPI0036DB17E1
MIKSVSKDFIYNKYSSNLTKRGKTIVLFHGWGSSASKYHDFAENLMSLGFKVVVPEIIYHDSRNKLENHFNKEVMQEYFWKTIFRSIDDSKLLLEKLGEEEKDIILMGISMGGFIANGIFASGNHFAGLININGSGSFLLSEKIFRENDCRPEMTDEEMYKINVYNPLGKVHSGSPILLMHGEQDSIVSIEGQKEYYNYLTEANAHYDVQLIVFDEVNHIFSEEMWESLKQWLDQKFFVLKDIH